MASSINQEPVNRDKEQQWSADIAASVAMYNEWFMKFAPSAYRDTRAKVAQDVEEALRVTKNLSDVSVATLKANPGILPTLRMSTCPPIAADRLVGLAGVPSSLVDRMEKEQKLPLRLTGDALDVELAKIGEVIAKMADPDVFVWLNRDTPPTETEVHKASTIVADRLCSMVANPIVRNAQEKRQLSVVQAWLESRGYKQAPAGTRFDAMPKGTYGFRMNVPIALTTTSTINIPIDTVIMPKDGDAKMPLLMEAKSAGDFTNVNKRRKEESVKMTQLRATYGKDVRFILFLCGYFDVGYLSYEAAEGIDWVWEHRVDDLAAFGL
jgi:hypothetical protein